MNLPGLKEFILTYESEETRIGYISDLEKFFKYCKKDPKNVTKMNILNYLTRLKKEGQSSASIGRRFSALRSYFGFLSTMDLIGENPFDRLKGILRLPRVQHKERKWLTDGEIRKFLSKIPNTNLGIRDKAIVYLMLYGGLRRGEVCGLNMGDIRKRSGAKNPQKRSKAAQALVIEIRGKGGKTRIRPLHPVCIPPIRRYLQSTGRLKAPKSDPMFLTRRGTRMIGSYIWELVRKYAKLANLGHFHPHAFRAKFASMAIESGAKITDLKEDMGHADINTTAGYDKAAKSYERSSIHRIKPIGKE